MAITKLSTAEFVKLGYGQVEPNHLSAQVTGQIYAQLPLAKTIKVLENGMFAKYDYEKNEVDFAGDGEWMLVYNTIKLYDENKQEDCDYAMINTTYEDENGKIAQAVVPASTDVVPRLFKTDVGDIFTTNTIKDASVKVGDELAPGSDGYLSTNGDKTAMVWQVVKVYTMPDGQPGAKIMRIK